jgi:hypothetical protein
LGVSAASKGVLFPKDSIGKSPIPSIATKISFTLFCLLQSRANTIAHLLFFCINVFLDRESGEFVLG